MSPQRAAGLVALWSRLYTLGLAPDVASRRREELAADVFEQVEHDRTSGVPDSRIARGLVSRAARGVVADVAWRAQQPRRAGGRMSSSVRRSALRVAVGTVLVLALPAVGMLVSEDVQWSAADFVLAGVLLALLGTVLELAVHRTGGYVTSAAVGVLGVLAMVLGEQDDAPGLVLLGLLLVAAAAVLATRLRSRTT